MEVERFNIDDVPDHGRPRVAEFRDKCGRLAVHVERDSGALWLFAEGPAGGDRGHVVFPVRMAARLGEWIAEGCRNAAPSTSGVFYLDQVDGLTKRRICVAARAGLARRSRWYMPIEGDALDELLLCLRSWSETMLRAAAA